MRGILVCLGAILALLGCTFSSAQPGAFGEAQPGLDRFADTAASLMQPGDADSAPVDWRTIGSARWIEWQPLPPAMLDKALPDGNYFVRKGTASFDGRRFEVSATGARNQVFDIYFRHRGAPLGEDAAIAALQRAGFEIALVRCPLPASPMASDNWWQIARKDLHPAFFHAENVCKGPGCERFALILADALPALTPDEQTRYTDQCSDDASGGPVAERGAIRTTPRNVQPS